METIKANEVVFDVFKTLYMIKTNEDLLEVFNMGVSIDIQTAITTAKNGLLSDKTLEYIEGIYNIIVDNESYLERYEKLIHTIKTEPVELTEEEFQIPRRYGKDKVVATITASVPPVTNTWSAVPFRLAVVTEPPAPVGAEAHTPSPLK